MGIDYFHTRVRRGVLETLIILRCRILVIMFDVCSLSLPHFHLVDQSLCLTWHHVLAQV